MKIKLPEKKSTPERKPISEGLKLSIDRIVAQNTIESIPVQMTSTNPDVVRLQEENRQLKESIVRLGEQLQAERDSNMGLIDKNLKNTPDSNPYYIKLGKDYYRVLELVDDVVESVLSYLKISEENAEMIEVIEDLVIPFLTHECSKNMRDSNSQDLAKLLKTHLEKNLKISIPLEVVSLGGIPEIIRFVTEIQKSDPLINWIAGKNAYDSTKHSPDNFKLEIKRITQPGLQVKSFVISKARVQVKYTDSSPKTSLDKEVVQLKQELMDLKTKRNVSISTGDDTREKVTTMMRTLRNSIANVVEAFAKEIDDYLGKIDPTEKKSVKLTLKKRIYVFLFRDSWDNLFKIYDVKTIEEATQKIRQLNQRDREWLGKLLSSALVEALTSYMAKRYKTVIESIKLKFEELAQAAISIILLNSSGPVELDIFFPNPGDEFVSSEEEPHSSGVNYILVDECLEPGLKVEGLVYLKSSVKLKLG